MGQRTALKMLEPLEAYRLILESRETSLEDPHNRPGEPDRVWYVMPDGTFWSFDGFSEREYPEYRFRPYRKYMESDEEFDARLEALERADQSPTTAHSGSRMRP